MDFCSKCGFLIDLPTNLINGTITCAACFLENEKTYLEDWSSPFHQHAVLNMDFCNKCGLLQKNNKVTGTGTCIEGSSMCRVCSELTSAEKNLNRTSTCGCEFCQGLNFKSINIDTENKRMVEHWQNEKDCAVSVEIREKWKREQHLYREKMVLEDNAEIKELLKAIELKRCDKTHYIAGMDISFIKGDEVNACAALVVVNYPDLQVVYEDYQMIQLTEPYIPGFLAFREADFLVDLYKKLVDTHPQFKPTVIFMDGNGLLHPREFGIACHVGVLIKTPCLGVAKNLIHIDGMESNEEFKASKQMLKKAGDTMPLRNSEGRTLGMALRSLDTTTNPVYVSPGHLVSLPTAVKLVKACCKYRIPEPVRKADLNSREYLRKLAEQDSIR